MGVNLIRIVATSILAIALGTAFGYGLNVVKPHESYRLRLDYEHRTRVPKPAATTEAGHLDSPVRLWVTRITIGSLSVKAEAIERVRYPGLKL